MGLRSFMRRVYLSFELLMFTSALMPKSIDFHRFPASVLPGREVVELCLSEISGVFCQPFLHSSVAGLDQHPWHPSWEFLGGLPADVSEYIKCQGARNGVEETGELLGLCCRVHRRMTLNARRTIR